MYMYMYMYNNYIIMYVSHNKVSVADSGRTVSDWSPGGAHVPANPPRHQTNAESALLAFFWGHTWEVKGHLYGKGVPWADNFSFVGSSAKSSKECSGKWCYFLHSTENAYMYLHVRTYAYIHVHVHCMHVHVHDQSYAYNTMYVHVHTCIYSMQPLNLRNSLKYVHKNV